MRLPLVPGLLSIHSPSKSGSERMAKREITLVTTLRLVYCSKSGRDDVQATFNGVEYDILGSNGAGALQIPRSQSVP
jgi:hypothetical protein